MPRLVLVRPGDEGRDAHVGERWMARENAGNQIGVGTCLLRYLHAIASDAAAPFLEVGHQRVGLAKTRRDPELHGHIRRLEGTEVCDDLGPHRTRLERR